jgi:predicted extracellular nuclease
MSDKRGIDVGFIYDAALFTVSDMFSHVVMRRTATRDILQVNFKTHRERLFVVVGNHWPSRSGGQHRSEGYRMIAGETLAYFHSRILEVHGEHTPVLAMGDFNDQPFDRSLTNYALSIRNRTRVIKGQNPYFLNLMWEFLQDDQATYYFGSVANILDQFLANKNMLLTNSVIRALPESVNIETVPRMVHPGDYPKPIAFGGMRKEVNRDGFSDHFPISMQVVEED